MPPPDLLQHRARVRATFKGKTVIAQVVMVSSNKQAAVLGFDGMHGSYVSMMPIVWSDQAGGYRDLVEDHDVIVEPYFPERSEQ